MVKSFFLNESGFVAPWTAFSGSWIVGVLAGAATLLGTVTPALADITCWIDCCGSRHTLHCTGDEVTICAISCLEWGSVCHINFDCS